MPNLNDGSFDGASQQAHDNAVGIEHYGLACGDVEHLADYFGKVGEGVVQLLCQNDYIQRGVRLRQ